MYLTGAQEWHIVSLLGDVTSTTTVAHYVSMTSDLRVLITKKHWQPRRQHTMYTNKRLEFTSEQVGRLRYVTPVDGELKRFPSVAWFAHPWCTWSRADRLKIDARRFSQLAQTDYNMKISQNLTKFSPSVPEVVIGFLTAFLCHPVLWSRCSNNVY